MFLRELGKLGVSASSCLFIARMLEKATHSVVRTEPSPVEIVLTA